MRYWVFLLLVCGCSSPRPELQLERPAQAEAVSAQLDPDLPERYLQHSPLLGQGGTPGPAGYAALAAAGYTTLLCVDGQPPDVARAKAAGLTVFHMPIGYGSPSDYARLVILRVGRAAKGPLYVYCQHGQHRGPTAAALIRMDRGVPSKQALDDLEQTLDPLYLGLSSAAQAFVAPNAAEVESVALPKEAIPPLPLGMAMLNADEHFTALRKDPRPTLAALLHQDFNEAARLAEGDLAADLRAAAAEAKALTDEVGSDLELRVEAFAERCVHCHVTYR